MKTIDFDSMDMWQIVAFRRRLRIWMMARAYQINGGTPDRGVALNDLVGELPGSPSKVLAELVAAAAFLEEMGEVNFSTNNISLTGSSINKLEMGFITGQLQSMYGWSGSAQEPFAFVLPAPGDPDVTPSQGTEPPINTKTP